MKSFRDTIKGVAERKAAEATPKQLALIEECLDVCRAWDRGELPLMEAKKLTGDGYLRLKVTYHVHARDDDDKRRWQAFIVALDEANKSNCDFGGWYGEVYLTMLQVVSDGGWIEKHFDPDLGDMRCIVKYPVVDLAKTPKRGGGSPTRPETMVEWFE